MRSSSSIYNYLKNVAFRIRHGKDIFCLKLNSNLLSISKNEQQIKTIELSNLTSATPRLKQGIIFEQVEIVLHCDKVESEYIIPEETRNFDALINYLIAERFLKKDWSKQLYSEDSQ